jgi:putative membrane protein
MNGRAAGLALACAVLAALTAGCGSQTAPATTPSLRVQTAPLVTSLVTPQGTWAVTVMGGSAASENNFWQLFVRPAGASRWSLVTPAGVADNGGLVATGGAGGASLMVGFRPSQGLVFSPLASSSDTGKTWAPGLLDADLADVPDALAVAPSGQVLALLHDGSVETAATAGAAAAGHWSQLTTLSALAASAPGRECGLVAVNAVSFGPNNVPMAAGSCVRRDVAGVFADTGGTWRAAGPALPAGFGGDQVQVLGLARTAGGDAALLLAGSDLLAAWSDGASWTVSGPVAAAGGVAASGFGPAGSVWVLLGGGRAETISGPGGSWRALAALPDGTATLAPGSGSSGYDALAVSGSRLTVWQEAAAGWTKVQVINVPIEYGSSSLGQEEDRAMNYLTEHWSFDPFLILAVVVAAWHEVGLWRLARRSRPERIRERRLRSLWFYGGLVVLLLAVESPIDYWSYDYFFVHMIQHLLLMFAAPTLIVAGAPWQALLEAGRGATGGGLAGSWSWPLRTAGRFVLRPWVSVALFNAAMILWHLPGPFDLADSNRTVHLWLMDGSFFAAGVLFWLQFIPSPPFRRRMPLVSQAAALLVTNFIMIGIAMALSIFVSGSVYSVYDHVPGVTLPPFSGQQLGAAILWVCGDFWALPTMIVIVRRLIATDGSVSAAVDKVLNRGPSRDSWSAWGRPRAGAGVLAQRPSPPDGES